MEKAEGTEGEDKPEGRQQAENPQRESESRPLVPLASPQKRLAKDPDLGAKRTSTVFKAPRTNEVLKPVARHAYNPWLAEPNPEMRARHSAPGQQTEGVSVELRGSKSAPDLRAPVLAAIRGLQNGSIQVDGRTRARIAHAAKRVLEAREVRRRSSQEDYHSQGPVELAAQVDDPKRQHPQATRNDDKVQAMPNIPPLEPLKTSRSSAAKSENLAAATGTSAEEAVPQDLEPGSRPGEARSGRASPFTVTTGVPRFSQGQEGLQISTASSLKQARTRSTPIPLMQMTRPTSRASLPRSLDFVSQLEQSADHKTVS